MERMLLLIQTKSSLVIFYLFIFIYFSFCLFQVKNLTINANNRGKVSVNELARKSDEGEGKYVGATISHQVSY
jgi:hypothetical protein